jgi:hypothetical protein
LVSIYLYGLPGIAVFWSPQQPWPF